MSSNEAVSKKIKLSYDQASYGIKNSNVSDYKESFVVDTAFELAGKALQEQYTCQYCQYTTENIKSARAHALKKHMGVEGSQSFTKGKNVFVVDTTFETKGKALQQQYACQYCQYTTENIKSARDHALKKHMGVEGSQTFTKRKNVLISAATLDQSRDNSTFSSIHNTSNSSGEFPFLSQSQLEQLSKKASSLLKGTMNQQIEYFEDCCIEKQAPKICIFCDVFIIGTMVPNWISKDLILQHSHRIDVNRWKEISGNNDLNLILRSQYLFPEEGFENLLLSPRSMKDPTTGKFLCCSTCCSSFRKEYIYSSPPKFSFANNFLIGLLPDDAWKTHETEQMNILLPLMIAPIRPFYYLFSINGGACKRMQGTVTFFSNAQSEMIGGLEALSNRVKNIIFFIVFQGRMTLEQKVIARNKVKVNYTQYKKLLQWMISNNQSIFKNIDLSNITIPTIIDRNDDTSQNLHDESRDPQVESQFDIRFYYPSTDSPSTSTGGFDSKESFLKAVLSGSTPTMYVYGKNFVSDINLKLESVLPMAFPFGIGGPGVKRENHVSYEECLRHYRNLCLPALHRDDVILVSYHLLNRILSFKSAIINCNKKVAENSTIAHQFSNITIKDLEEAVDARQSHINNGINDTGVTTKFLRTVEACCRPLQHTAEAATAARGKYFAMFDQFGSGAIFVTISPTGSRNLRVRAYAEGKMIKLPSPWKMTNEECAMYLDEMTNLNQFYPGAGEIEFRSQLDIFIEHILNWDIKRQKAKGIGAFGLVMAYGISVEDQLMGNLHAHMLIHIKGTYILRNHTTYKKYYI